MFFIMGISINTLPNFHYSLSEVQAYGDRIKSSSTDTPDYLEKWLKHAEALEAISLQNGVFITLWDMVSNQIVYAVDRTNVFGSYRSMFLIDHVQFSICNYAADRPDAVMAMKKVGFEYCLNHLDVVKEVVINHDCVFNFNGDQVHFIEQALVVETNAEGYPLLFLCFLYDISHLKIPSASLVITTPEHKLMWNYDYTRNRLDRVSPITKKAREIINMLACGKSTKSIAQQLGLSRHTVDTHRRNLLAKTKCKDTTAMITYCKMVGLI